MVSQPLIRCVCVAWRYVFVESPCKEVGFSSYLWPSRRCAWSPAFPLDGLLQMRHTCPVGAACVGSFAAQPSFLSVCDPHFLPGRRSLKCRHSPFDGRYLDPLCLIQRPDERTM